MADDAKVVWEFITGDNLQAPVQRSAIDRVDGTVYLATFGNLYSVRDGVGSTGNETTST